MPTGRIKVRCPHCQKKLLISPSRTRLACPYCDGESTIADGIIHPLANGPRTEMVPGLMDDLAVGGEKPRVERPGFARSLAMQWREDRGGVFLKLILALLSASLLSLSKPFIGPRGMIYALGGLAATAMACSILYFLSRTLAHVVRADDPDEERPVSVLAWFAYFGLIATLFAWGPVVIADAFSPARGWLATLVPRLNDAQGRVFLAIGPIPTNPREALASAPKVVADASTGPAAPPPSGAGDVHAPSGPQETLSVPPPSGRPMTYEEIVEAESIRLRAEKQSQDREDDQEAAAERTDDTVVQLLIDNLKCDDARLRAQAGLKLQAMGDRASARAAIPALTRIIVENRDGRDINWGSNKTAALGALKVLAPAKVKATLLRAARSKDPGVKLWSIDRLAELEGVK